MWPPRCGRLAPSPFRWEAISWSWLTKFGGSNFSDQEIRHWKAKIAQFHKAAGHPTNADLARLVKNAGQPQWKVDAALRHRCPGCEALRPGGVSSGQIRPASTAPMFRHCRVASPRNSNEGPFSLMIDLATKMRAVHFIKQYANLAMEHENAEDVKST